MLDYVVKWDGASQDVVVELLGELAGERWTSLIHQSLEDHYVDDGVLWIRVDLGGVRFIDSNGVVTLISLQRRSRAQGKRFTVENAAGQVREKLIVTGMLAFLEGHIPE